MRSSCNFSTKQHGSHVPFDDVSINVQFAGRGLDERRAGIVLCTDPAYPDARVRPCAARRLTFSCWLAGGFFPYRECDSDADRRMTGEFRLLWFPARRPTFWVLLFFL